MTDSRPPAWSSCTTDEPLARAVGPARSVVTRRAADPGRRPLEEGELADARALGLLLVDLRRERNLTQVDVAARAGLAVRSLRRLEQGERRTRLSTLQRLATALEPGDPVRLAAHLTMTAGVALAEESAYAERVERRRRRRQAAASRRFVTEVVIRREESSAGVAETVTTRRRVGRHRIVESVRSRWVSASASP